MYLCIDKLLAVGLAVCVGGELGYWTQLHPLSVFTVCGEVWRAICVKQMCDVLKLVMVNPDLFKDSGYSESLTNMIRVVRVTRVT